VHTKVDRAEKDFGYVNIYRPTNNDTLNVKRFETADHEWLEYVLTNRTRAVDTLAEYDVIIGPVANDSVGVTLNNLIMGVYGNPDSQTAKDIAISLLLTQKLHDQVVLKTQKAVDSITFTEAEKIEC
jgi:hypothetical protein